MNYKLYHLAVEFTMNYQLYQLESEFTMNYRLYKIAADRILRNVLPGNYNDKWLEAHVRDEYKGLNAREIEHKIQELYELLEVAFDMGINYSIAEEERLFHWGNGVNYTNSEVQELWATKYEGVE